MFSLILQSYQFVSGRQRNSVKQFSKSAQLDATAADPTIHVGSECDAFSVQERKTDFFFEEIRFFCHVEKNNTFSCVQ